MGLLIPGKRLWMLIVRMRRSLTYGMSLKLDSLSVTLVTDDFCFTDSDSDIKIANSQFPPWRLSTLMDLWIARFIISAREQFVELSGCSFLAFLVQTEHTHAGVLSMVWDWAFILASFLSSSSTYIKSKASTAATPTFVFFSGGTWGFNKVWFDFIYTWNSLGTKQKIVGCFLNPA